MCISYWIDDVWGELSGLQGMYADNCLYHHPDHLQMISYNFVLSTAVIIAGRPATGKSSALSTVVSTLNAIQGSVSSNIKLVKIYPDTYESLSELYGCVSSPGGEWVDGIFTSAFRKAHKVRSLGNAWH